MEPFEYVVVLTSLILGLGITQILIGIAEMVVRSGSGRLSLRHSLMILIVFILHIQEWWVSYQYSKEIMLWTLPIVLCLLVYPILLYVMARILFPDNDKQLQDLDGYYDDHWRRFFVVLVLVGITSIWQNWLISDIPVYDQISQVLFIVSLVVFIFGKVMNRSVHIAYLTLITVAWVYYIFADMSTLSM